MQVPTVLVILLSFSLSAFAQQQNPHLLYSITTVDAYGACVSIPESTCTPCTGEYSQIYYLYYNQTNMVNGKVQYLYSFTDSSCSVRSYFNPYVQDAIYDCQCSRENSGCSTCSSIYSFTTGVNGLTLSLSSNDQINVTFLESSGSRIAELSSSKIQLTGSLNGVLIESNDSYFIFEKDLGNNLYSTSLGGPFQYGTLITIDPFYFTVSTDQTTYFPTDRDFNSTFAFPAFNQVSVSGTSDLSFPIVFDHEYNDMLFVSATSGFDFDGLMVGNENYIATSLTFVPNYSGANDGYSSMISQIKTPNQQYGDPFMTINCFLWSPTNITYCSYPYNVPFG